MYYIVCVSVREKGLEFEDTAGKEQLKIHWMYPMSKSLIPLRERERESNREKDRYGEGQSE